MNTCHDSRLNKRTCWCLLGFCVTFLLLTFTICGIMHVKECYWNSQKFSWLESERRSEMRQEISQLVERIDVTQEELRRVREMFYSEIAKNNINKYN